jgi:hypothetical protein
MILRGILTLSLLAAVINADDTAAYVPSITVANESDPPASTLKSTPTLATPLQTASGSKYCKPGYTLVWNDEFSSLASRQKWDFQRGDGSFYGIPGWGNNELVSCHHTTVGGFAIHATIPCLLKRPPSNLYTGYYNTFSMRFFLLTTANASQLTSP